MYIERIFGPPPLLGQKQPKIIRGLVGPSIVVVWRQELVRSIAPMLGYVVITNKGGKQMKIFVRGVRKIEFFVKNIKNLYIMLTWLKGWRRF